MVSRAYILSFAMVTKLYLCGKTVIQMAMDLMQHTIYIGHPYDMMYVLEYAVFR